MKLGDLDLRLVDAGRFRLDGGAMHGVVPWTIWSRLAHPDERNRVEYSTRCLLVESAGRRILVETGNGDKWDAKARDIYAFEPGRTAAAALADIGVAAESIDRVVLTHLHFDHAGGLTHREGGRAVPTFPCARLVVQKREWYDATHPHERNRASYLADDFVPLWEAGRVDLVDGEAEVAPGVRVVPTPGHTPGHQSVRLDSRGETALFLGDVVPTSVHVRLPFVMAYDLEPVVTLASKRALLGRAAAGGWLVVWGHDAEHEAGRLGLGPDGRPVLREPVAIGG